jgi:hypothetical protein
MNKFKLSVLKILKDSGDAFKTFPAAMGCAAAFALVTIIRIQLDWQYQEPNNFLFNCLHWSFAFGALFNLALITGAQSRINTRKAFLYANIIGVAAVAAVFFGLYFFGASDPMVTGARFAVISNIAAARISVLMGVSLLVFIVLAGFPKEHSDFARSFFMTHKAFQIALIYGIVIMAGTSGVAGAVEVLLYNDMSEKVYMYIATLVGFLAFTIFVGYFPDFRKGETDEHREVAQKQPRFIEVLFGYILVPIVLALTAVLLIWAAKTMFGGIQSEFYMLYRIAAAYTVVGIWLHIMISHYETGIAKFYKRVYPLAAIVILAFEAWALFSQLGESGLKFTEYAFGVLWILAAAAAVLLMVMKEKSHPIIVVVASVLAVCYVLPILGYNALPVTAQGNRLKNLLVSEGMLQNDIITPAAAEPELAVRQGITDAVDYLAYANDAKLPSWFDKTLALPTNFKDTMGFEKVWPEVDNNFPGTDGYLSTNVYLQSQPIDISDYRWAVNPQEEYQKGQLYTTVTGEKGAYDVYWDNTSFGIPLLRIIKDGTVILEEDLGDFIDAIGEKYPPSQYEPIPAGLEDMSFTLTCPELTVLVVIRNAEIHLDPKEDVIGYWINLESIYIYEN